MSKSDDMAFGKKAAARHMQRAFYEEMAAGLLQTAMGCDDARMRTLLIRWANVYIERLEQARDTLRAPALLH
jgi:hypothetical protein